MVCGECFCFQAEDGIRDLVRSRGLGDVYKRQVRTGRGDALVLVENLGRGAQHLLQARGAAQRARPVSYTHLTLPTSALV